MEQVKVQIAVANAQELLQVRGRAGGGGRGRRGPRAAGDARGRASRLKARLSPQRMTDKCFRKCIGKPGGSLDNSEQVRPARLAGVAGRDPARGLCACAD